MRWKRRIHQTEIEPLPEQGEEKWKVKFAFIPVRVINNGVVWLENYKALYRWTTRRHKTRGLSYLSSDGSPLVDNRITGWHWIRNEPVKWDHLNK